jgi:hypothetical protein
MSEGSNNNGKPFTSSSSFVNNLTIAAGGSISTSHFLQNFKVNFSVLSKVTAGEVISIGENGEWSVVTATAWRSAIRTLISRVLYRRGYVPAQRDAFLDAIVVLVQNMEGIVSTMMNGQVFKKSLNSLGYLSQTTMLQSLSASEMEEMEYILHELQSLIYHIHQGLKGIQVLTNNLPYSDDTTFCSKLIIYVRDRLCHFLDAVLRKVGPEYKNRIFMIMNSTTSTAATTSSTSTTNPSMNTHNTNTNTNSNSSIWLFGSGSANVPAFYNQQQQQAQQNQDVQFKKVNGQSQQQPTSSTSTSTSTSSSSLTNPSVSTKK